MFFQLLVLLFLGLSSAAPEGDANPDPKANPQWWGYGGLGYGYGYGWPHYSGYSYIGKRSADAEPAPNRFP